MSATPITATVLPGTRAPLPVSNATLVIGAASAGTDNAIVKISSTSELLEEFAASSTAPGPLCHCAAMYLSIAKSPLYCMRINDSSAGTMGSVTKTAAGAGTGTVANNSSVPVDAFSVIIEILSTGTVTAGTFTYRYSLDGGDNYTGTIQGPTNGGGSSNVSLGTTGISVTFADGGGPTTGFLDGDLFSFSTTAPGWGTSDLQAALDAFISSEYRVRRIHVVGVSSSTIHAAIIARMATAFAAYKYARVIEETDDQTAGESVSGWANSVILDYTTASNRTVVAPGWIEITLPLAQDNLSLQLRRPIAWTIGPRQAAIDVSQDAGAVIDGPLQQVVLSDTYPFAQDTRSYTGYEGRGFTTAQTYIGRSGVYCSGVFSRSDAADASHRLAHGQVLDVLLETLYDLLLDYINTNVPANSDGTIAETAAASIEAQLNGAIEQVAVNVTPQRISPSDERQYVVVDRSNVISSTHQLRVTLAYQQRPFIDSVALFVSQTLSVPVA